MITVNGINSKKIGINQWADRRRRQEIIKMEILLWPRMQFEYATFMNVYSMALSWLSSVFRALLSTAKTNWLTIYIKKATRVDNR